MLKLNLGSGILVKKGFTNVDLYKVEDMKNHTGPCKQSIWEKGGKYIQADIRMLPFKDNSVDYVEMFEVLEHMPFRQVVGVLKEIRRVMKPEAKMRLHTPNFDGLAKDWIDIITSKFDIKVYMGVIETIYGNQAANGEFHNCPFNPSLMNYFLTQAGFMKGKIEVIRKHTPLPTFGSEKFAKKSMARNEILLVEVEK